MYIARRIKAACYPYLTLSIIIDGNNVHARNQNNIKLNVPRSSYTTPVIFVGCYPKREFLKIVY